MFADRFATMLTFTGRRRKTISAGILVAFVACLGALNTVTFDNNFEMMLPGDREFARGISFLQESHLSGQVILSLYLQDPQKTLVDLTATADTLVEDIRSPLIDAVVTGKALQDQLGDMGAIIRNVPGLLDESALKALETRISEKEIEKRLRAIYLQAMNPGGFGAFDLQRKDPLGIGSRVFEELGKILRNMEFDVTVKMGHLVNRDHNRIMILLKTSVPVADGNGSGRLLEWIASRIVSLPSYVSVDVVCGHRHSVSNEAVIRSDVRIAIAAAAVGFAILFLLVLRDVRALLIFAIPFVSISFAVVLSSLFLQRLSFFIVGMGGVVAGIAVDYGIHVFMAVKSEGGNPAAVKKIVRPVVFGALTTAGIFIAFLFSGVAGYRQLGIFSIISIFFCLIFSLLLLPHFLATKSKTKQYSLVFFETFVNRNKNANLSRWIWGFCMVLLFIFSFRAGFESDIRQMDGSTPDVRQAEERLLDAWGRGDAPAIFVVAAATLDSALVTNEAVFKEVVAAGAGEHFTSIAPLMPSEKTRIRNIRSWQRFWEGRRQPLEKRIRQAGAKYGFREDAFEPFFRFLETNPEKLNAAEQTDSSAGGWLQGQLRERFITAGGGEIRVLSFFPDKDAELDALQRISQHHPGTFVVSRSQISRDLSKAVKRQVIFLSIASGLLIVLLTLVMLRNLRLTLLALIPVISGLVTITGIFGITGGRLNAAGLMAAVMVMGLCIDYGIFMVYAGRHHLSAGTSTAVAVSAATTVIGASALLFAGHPALNNIGIVLVSGIMGGFVSALLIIPGFSGKTGRPDQVKT